MGQNIASCKSEQAVEKSVLVAEELKADPRAACEAACNRVNVGAAGILHEATPIAMKRSKPGKFPIRSYRVYKRLARLFNDLALSG